MVVLAGIGETIDAADGEVVKWILTGNPVLARAPIACFETGPGGICCDHGHRMSGELQAMTRYWDGMTNDEGTGKVRWNWQKK